MAAPAGGAAAAAPAVEEKTTFDVVLEEIPADKKVGDTLNSTVSGELVVVKWLQSAKDVNVSPCCEGHGRQFLNSCCSWQLHGAFR